MNRKIRTYLLMGLFLTAVGGMEQVSAAEGQVYDLAPVTVTATRYASKDLNVGESTQIVTSEQLQQTGQTNLQQALSFLDSVVYNSMGSNGTAASSMTSKIIIRGVEDGTLVMINGTPVNWRRKYNLEDIPLESIEKVEVIRGGGAVLYGSQATGGVINIITKKKLPNQVQAGLGNYGQQDYKVSANAGDFSFAYHYNKWGDTGLISSTWPSADYPVRTKTSKEMRMRFKKAEKNDFLATYKINDSLDFLYNHDESTNNWEYTFQRGTPLSYRGAVRYDRKYERDKDFAQFNYHDENGYSGHFYYNRNTLETHGHDYRDSKGSLLKTPSAVWNKEKNLSYGYDFQKLWTGKKQTFLLGTSWEKNGYKDYSEGIQKNDYSRNIFSVFGSWDRDLTDLDKIILSARETWTTGAAEDKNFNNFSGQVQYIHKLDHDQSIYASAGQSFVLPTFSEMYSDGTRAGVNLIGDSNLKPEKGQHYELGWKKETDKAQYKVALFEERIKDNITYSKGSGNYADKWFARNEDFKNHGLEASMTIKQNEHVTWHTGITWQNPKTKVNSDKLGDKNYWDRTYGRFILNAGLSYQKDKWAAALNANYLADRVLSPTTAHSFDEKPYLLTALNLKYSPNKNSDISLTVNNILNRDDNINHTSSHYSSTPINWILTYGYKF